MIKLIDYYLILVATLLGAGLASFLPYFRKLVNGKISGFETKFIITAVINSITGIITTFTIYSSWSPPPGIENDIIILLMAFVFGFGGDTLQKEVMKYYSLIKEIKDMDVT